MLKKLSFTDSEREYLMFFIVTALTVFKYSYFGFSYTPYLDDYVQYSFYPSYPNAWQNILAGGHGVLFTRPLAGLFDFFIWSNFYKNLGVVVAIILILYGLSAVFFYKAAKRCGIALGPIFFAVYLFLPLVSEGTYWVSASTRVVPSLFLISASLLAATRKKTFLFFLLNFLSVWFYEQTAILSFICAFLVALKLKSKKIFFLALASITALGIFYLNLGSLGDNASRLQTASIPQLFENFLKTFKALFEVLGKINTKIIFKGFARGFKILAVDFSIFWLMVLLALIIVFSNLSQVIQAKSNKRNGIITGFILFFVPLIPFLLVKNSVFNLRNIVPAMLGISILADNALCIFFKKYAALAAAFMIFVFSISSVSEINDFNLVASNDQKIATKIANQIAPDTKKIEIKTTSPKYPPQNAPYNDHIMSMTGSDWGPTGIVRTISKNPDVIVIISE